MWVDGIDWSEVVGVSERFGGSLHWEFGNGKSTTMFLLSTWRLSRALCANFASFDTQNRQTQTPLIVDLSWIFLFCLSAQSARRACLFLLVRYPSRSIGNWTHNLFPVGFSLELLWVALFFCLPLCWLLLSNASLLGLLCPRTFFSSLVASCF